MQLFGAARKLAASNLPVLAQTPDRFGVGFAICHEAQNFDTVTLDWWERSNELRHLVFRSYGNEIASKTSRPWARPPVFGS